jgi:3-oxoadipate enol-lactonase
MPVARVGDINVYYELHGQGTPLVLIGGLGTDVTPYAGITDWLAQRFQVLAFDNRGAGRTDKPDAPYTIGQMADDTAGLMEALSIERAHVVGISMGGRIALELALRHPGRVAKLILVSTSAAGRGKLTMSWPMHVAGLLKRAGLFRGKYPQPDYAHDRQRQASVGYDATGRIAEIRAPTLILHGRRDKSMPLEAAERMHAGIGGSQFEVFRGGHMFFLLAERQPFLDRVAEFLAG